MKSGSYFGNHFIYVQLNRLSIDQYNKMASVSRGKFLKHVLHYQNIFEERGLIYLQKERGSDTSFNRRFWSMFSVSGLACSRVWKLLQLSPMDTKKINPDHLLWGLLLLKVDSFEETRSGTAWVDETTFYKWLHFSIVRIIDMHSEIVSYMLYYFH